MNASEEMTRGRDVRLDALVSAYSALEGSPDQKADKVCEAFIKTIESGYWRPGDFVPTEKEIAAVLPVSLGTVQIALRRLASGGVINRMRGLGTTITIPSDPGLEPKHVRYFADDGRSLLPHDIELISISETGDQGAWSDYLGLRTSYIRIVRHISVGGEFTVYNEFFLDGARFRPLLDIAPETLRRLHLRLVLHDRFNCPTLGFDQNIGFVKPEAAVAKVIGIEPGTLALRHEIMSHSLRKSPLSYQEMIIPPNDRRLNISGTM